MIPLVLPLIVTALAVYVVFLKLGLIGTGLGFILAHTASAVPFVIVPVLASLKGQDPVFVRAAATLGASPLAAFRDVTLRLAAPGIFTGAVFAFSTSFDEVVGSLFLQSPGRRTLPVQMYQIVDAQTDPTRPTASTVLR